MAIDHTRYGASGSDELLFRCHGCGVHFCDGAAGPGSCPRCGAIGGHERCGRPCTHEPTAFDGQAPPTGMEDPHADQPIETAGAPLAGAEAAVVLTHGRGATAAGMLDIARQLDVSGVSYRALQASRRTWYPNSFMASVDSNEPHLSSALSFLDRAVAEVREAGLSRDRIVFVGFSQGACLASEYVARNATLYGGLGGLSGGLIGPEGAEFNYDGDLDGMPVFLGCSDVDPHIPVERVHETREVLEGLGGDVTERIYEGMGHTVNRDELDQLQEIVAGVVG